MPPRLDAHAHFFRPGYVDVLPESCRRVEPDEVTLETADPRIGDGAALIGELVAFLEPLYPEDEEEAPAPWSLQQVEQTFVVARVAGVAAGCGGLAPCSEAGAMEIVRMYVRPGFRGRQLADRVLAELEQMARAGVRQQRRHDHSLGARECRRLAEAAESRSGAHHVRHE